MLERRAVCLAVIATRLYFEVHQKIKNGADFGVMAEQFSDDRQSAAEGGKLPEFGAGSLSDSNFEEIAFSLKKDEVSRPFKSKFGWHIVKLLQKQPIKSYNEEWFALEKKVKRDSRSKLVTNAFIERLKSQYKFKEQSTTKNKLFNREDFYFLDPALNKTRADDELLNSIVFFIGENKFTINAFAKFVKRTAPRGSIKKSDGSLQRLYEAYIQNAILKHHEENLEIVNEEYATIVSEYRDGLLLFNIMQDKIWEKSSKDSVSIHRYFNENREKYRWNKRVNVLMAYTSEKERANEVQLFLKKQDDVNAIRKQFGTQDVIISEQQLEIDDIRLPKEYLLKTGLPQIYQLPDKTYQVILTKTVLKEDDKTFAEARTRIMNDYREFLEEEWLKELRNQNTIEINNKVYTKLKASLVGND